ncbi:MAG TPA: VWA domain-containing protein [Xanthomonadaceae bacterium]|nr:VWA domain-containing protein [Xanthomonadaceae bacterium]
MTDLLPAAFSDLHLLRPQWLLALLALPLLGWWWHRRRVRASAWRDAVDPHLLPHLLDAGAGRRGRATLVAAASAYVLAVLALAGPSWQQVSQPAWRAPAPLVVALDLSDAVLAADLPPSRLLQARAKIAALLEARTGGQVGLVAYAGDAFTVAPLTDDAANVALFLDALEPSVMPVGGQRADRAIEWSARLLRQAGFDRGDILLLTDHADPPAIAAATAAHAAGYDVSALGLGTPAGSAYRGPAGGIEHARLDASSLRALAAAGGGGYQTLARDLSDLRALGVLDPRLAGVEREEGDARGRQWLDGGFWLLPLLMFVALLAFRRGGAVAAVLLLAWLPMRPAAAFDFADLWSRPDQQRHAQLMRGAEAYRAGEFEQAARAWEELPTADAQYNLGNALAKAGKYREAIDAYDRALSREPGMADAIANRAAVQALLDRMPPGSDGEGDDEGDDPGDPSGEGAQGEGDPGSGEGAPSAGAEGDGEPAPGDHRAPPRRTGDPGDPDDATDGAPPGTEPADEQAQAAADAAQRERMAQAMQAREDGAEHREAGPGKVAEPGETDAERERRIANQAWLQRVPDDPGGLLRRKFALEYQRRLEEGRR